MGSTAFWLTGWVIGTGVILLWRWFHKPRVQVCEGCGARLVYGAWTLAGHRFCGLPCVERYRDQHAGAKP